MYKYEITETNLKGACYLYANSASEAFGDYMFLFPDAPVSEIKVKFLEEVGA